MLTAGDGELLILHRGARMLGLFIAKCEENLLWTHPALRAADSADALFVEGGWNVGGDRTWLAPEVDVCFPAFPDTSICRCPAALDPGGYQARATGTDEASSVLVNRFGLILSRAKSTVSLELAKGWHAAAYPLLPGAEPLPADVAHVGYTQTSTLTVLGCDRLVEIGLWSLLQVPYGGECLVSTHGVASTVPYVGAVTPGELRASERLLRYRPSTPGIHKIGIRAQALTGRVGYLQQVGDTATLVVRAFDVDPTGAYVDTAWRTPDDLAAPGCPAQLCAVDDAALGRYVELEHHAPALRIDPASGVAPMGAATDVSRVWAFRGSAPQVRTIAERIFEYIPN